MGEVSITAVSVRVQLDGKEPIFHIDYVDEETHDKVHALATIKPNHEKQKAEVMFQEIKVENKLQSPDDLKEEDRKTLEGRILAIADQLAQQLVFGAMRRSLGMDD